MTFAAQLNAWRETQRYTQAATAEYLSRELGASVSTRTVEEWCYGRTAPKGIAAAAILRAMNQAKHESKCL